MVDGLSLSRMKRAALAVALTVCAISACFAPARPAWQRIQQTGTLRVGMDPSFPPFESVAADGSLQGLDVDLAREIARRLGVEAHFVANLPYDGLYDALTAQRVDLVISALAVDSRRMDDYVYSRSYFNAGQVLVGRVGQASVGSMSDLEGHRLAVVLGTEGDREGRRWARRLTGLVLAQYRTPAQALSAVKRGEMDVALVDHVSALQTLDEARDLTIMGEPVIDVSYACAMRHDEEQLLQAVDGALISMEDDGTMETLITRWLR